MRYYSEQIRFSKISSIEWFLQRRQVSVSGGLGTVSYGTVESK